MIDQADSIRDLTRLVGELNALTSTIAAESGSHRDGKPADGKAAALSRGPITTEQRRLLAAQAADVAARLANLLGVEVPRAR